MKEIIENENVEIEKMIYEIRGVEVMLDRDLAKLYQCTNGTKDINKAVNRNIERFPGDFYFQLTEKEKNYLWFQSGTANNMSRTNPYVFTEQGVAMLASVLHTKVAVEMSVKIMRSFVKMRHYINYNNVLLPHKFMLLEDRVDKNTQRINELFDKFDPKVIVKDYIYFQGDFYDAYSTLISILKLAKSEIIIIDNYIGNELLDILKSINKDIVIISKKFDDVLKSKYVSQYKNITFKVDDSFHDRFIIIDKSRLFVCGASLKDLGKKCFAIYENRSDFYLREILNIISGNKI